jgi:tetratricopeptide (TPR) repeat protein
MNEAMNQGRKPGEPSTHDSAGDGGPVKDPDPALLQFQTAAEYQRSGDKQQALQLCDQLLANGPPQDLLPAILHLRAVILAEQGYLLAASRCISEALQIRPDIAAMHEHAARIHAALGLTEAARAEAETACRLAPDNIAWRYQLARQLRLAGDLDSAVHEAQACLDAQPHFDEARILLSEVRAEQGQAEAAVAQLSAVVAHDPDHVRAWAMLANSEPALIDELPVKQALTRLADASRGAGTAARANFALGQRALRDGDSQRAFRRFRTANELRSAAEPFDIDAWEQRVARILATNRDAGHHQANAAATDEAGRRLVFVMGMPRSGTTLCEQVLSAHADVYGAGELPGMEQLCNELRRHGLDAAIPLLDPDWRERMRDSYLQLLPGESAGHARIVDKAPRNFERIDLILTLFPAAQVIWMLRHPLDTVLSCYEQDFGPGQGFSNRLSHAARFYLGHLRLLRAALRHYGQSVRVVGYARFVTQLETVAREIADFIGVGFDPAMLRPELNPRQVRTASSSQVRRPVYTSGIDRWRKVADQLAPARAVFEDAGLIDAEGNSRVSGWLDEHTPEHGPSPRGEL